MELNVYQVDSFISEVSKGNPAAVCITKKELGKQLMLSIAKKMDVSETSFLSLDEMKLRWFTPETEVQLCGHGTLAVAHILNESGMISLNEFTEFKTLSGYLKVIVKDDKISIVLPISKPKKDVHINSNILNFLGINENDIIEYCKFDSKIFIEIERESDLSALSPDFFALRRLKGRGIVVTARSTLPDIDFVSRYFAPWVGVNEDPVTGSAHCALGFYWGNKLGKIRLRGYQLSDRGGIVDVELLSEEKVKLSGKARTVFSKTLHI
jgi:PhzF family phenazine biosynthesis protein